MASQTETQKSGTEETKNIDKENMAGEEEKTSKDDSTTVENTVNKQTIIENTTKCENESEDLEETEFEIIGTQVVTNTNEIKLDAVETIVNIDQKNETCSIEKIVTDLKEEEKKSSLMDINVIKESEDNSTKYIPRSEAQSFEELEDALTVITEMYSSLSKEILAESPEEREARKIVKDIEIKREEIQDKALVDIPIIEETNKENNVQDTIQESDNSFEAEVIEDDADIQVVPSDGEDVIEYTIEAGDVIPFLTIIVAVVAIVMGLVYYYNNSGNTVVTDDVLEEQQEQEGEEEQEEEMKEGEILWF